MKRAIFVLLLLAGVTGGLPGIERFQQQPGRFSAVDLNGKTVDLESLKGKIAFVTYWQVSCYPCRRELPRLDALQRELKGKPVVFLSLNPWNKKKDIKAFRDGRNPAKRKLKSMRFLTRAPRTNVWGLPASKRGYIGTPTTVILDQKGTVVGRSVGGMNPEAVRKLIDELLAAAPDNTGASEDEMVIQGRIRIRGMREKSAFQAPAPEARIEARTTGPEWRE